MSSLVIGGGLLGLSTALALLERGESVTVVEAREAAGLETSFANGGMLTPGLPEPWNGPGIFRHLLGALFRPGAATRIRPSAIPSLAGWGIAFLRNATAARYHAACRDNFRLATLSLAETLAATQRHGLQYDFDAGGSLCLFRDRHALQDRWQLCTRLQALGLAASQVAPGRIVDMEPLLAPLARTLAGGVWLPGDARGDAHRFCQALETTVCTLGARTMFGARVTALVVEGKRVTGVRVGAEMLPAGRVVVAAGATSRSLLEPLGLRLPIRPAKGYSLTIHGLGDGHLPGRCLVDDASHVVFSTLGDRLRVAGTAEFAGFDARLSAARIASLHRGLASVLPAVAATGQAAAAVPWAGFRPMSADGRPFVGGTAIDGLYVNTGHGALGWTQAMGSARLVADLVTGSSPAIDPAPFRTGRPLVA